MYNDNHYTQLHTMHLQQATVQLVLPVMLILSYVSYITRQLGNLSQKQVLLTLAKVSYSS